MGGVKEMKRKLAEAIVANEKDWCVKELPCSFHAPIRE